MLVSKRPDPRVKALLRTDSASVLLDVRIQILHDTVGRVHVLLLSALWSGRCGQEHAGSSEEGEERDLHRNGLSIEGMIGDGWTKD